MPTKYCTIHLQQDTQAIRIQEFDGREHIVVPAIGLVEGVLRGANSSQPELALAEEFGKFPDAWNGRPVTFGHPEKDSNFVSAASSPEVFEEEAAGIIFNTKIDGTKLKMEFFLDPDKAPPSEIKRLRGGKTVEVSTGFFADVLPVQGNFQGEDFGGIFTNIAPDHIAILGEDEIGACSVEDGCGAPRLNSLKVNSQGEVTISHKDCETCRSKEKKVKSNASRFFFDSLIQFSDEGEALSLGEDVAVEELGKTPLAFVLVDFQKDSRIDESFGDKAGAFDRAGELADQIRGHIGVAESVGVRTNKIVVYRLIASFVGDSRMNAKKKVDFGNNVTENGNEITESDNFLSSLVKKVKRLLQTEEIRMDKAELIARVVANEATPFVEEDIEALEGFSEERLEALANIKASEKAEEGSGGASEAGETSEEGDVETFTATEVFETLPTEVQAMLKRSLEEEKAKRTALTAQIRKQKDCPYSSEQLDAFDLDELSTLAKWTSKLSGESEDFSGQGAPGVNSGGEVEYVAPRVGRIFDIKQAAA